MGHEEEEEKCDEGAVRGPKHVRDIYQPSEEEVVKHNLTHLPFRNWCSRCLKGRGKEAPHRRIEGGGRVNSLRLVLTFAFPPETLEQED